MPSATIKLFLLHGDAKRLRTAELSNWTGKAVAGPRSELDGVLAREETAKSGVYFLSGIDPASGIGCAATLTEIFGITSSSSLARTRT